LIFIAVMALSLAACSRGPRQYRPVVDPELLKLTKEQVFEKAEEQFERERWKKAREYYSYIYETFPNDPLGRRSLLRVADTFYMQGDPVNLVEAQYKYRDFVNRFPTSEYADYATLQIAMSSFKQMERPDRDQQKTHEAIEKFNDMIRNFPNSPLRAEAEAKRQEARDRLGKHELIVARFYMNRGSWNAAVQRLNYLIDNFPNFAERDAAFYDLGRSLTRLGRTGEARLYFERVVSEFPDSEYADEARQQLNQTKA
jgi:outer membrane assembly lipoprotein YfiO